MVSWRCNFCRIETTDVQGRLVFELPLALVLKILADPRLI